LDLPRFDNRTEFVAQPRVLLGKDGERLVVIVKATFALQPNGEVSLVDREHRRGLRAVDVPWGEPEKSSVKYPGDLCIQKPGTDVVVVAAAHAPREKPAAWFDAGVRVGRLEKTVRYFGLRVWQDGGEGLSEPRPTTGGPLRYDDAWGGLDVSDDGPILEEPRNPVGRGVARDPRTLTHQPAPSIEDPLAPIQSFRTRPPPAGLGAIGRHWEPRRRYIGTFDAAWLETRAPLLPLDHDERANLCASPGLTATPPLVGGERIALLNLTPGGGTESLQLPRIRVAVTFSAKEREPVTLRPYLDTVLIDTLAAGEARAVLELVWRAAFKPTRRMKDARIVVAEEAAS
jgi:hypothetical protein